MKHYISTFVIIGTLLTACVENETTEIEQETIPTTTETQSLAQLTAGIHPPVPGIGVAFVQEKLTAESGGSFVYETGSIVTFPPNAVLHEDGTPVSGEFDVEYREFQDPIDMFFSGIPMNYDSAGVEYNFISAGMCELKASQNGEALYVNPDANPSVAMVSKDDDPVHNLYYYDESTNEWKSKGKSKIEAIKDVEEKPIMTVEIPVKPQKADPQKYSFYISIEELGSEFEGFDNMTFQIADEEKNYNPADAGIQWYSVDVKKWEKKKGKYLVTFANATTSRTYITDPVFSDEEYEVAMSKYNEVLAEKEETIKKQEEEMAKWKAEQAIIIEQNRKIDSINKVIAEQNALTLKYNDSISKLQAQQPDASINPKFQYPQNSYTVTRGLILDGFGVWNCDNPAFQDGFVMTAVDFKGVKIKNPYYEINPELFDEFIHSFSVIYEGYNSIMQDMNESYKNLTGVSEMLFTISDGVLYVIHVVDDTESVAQTPKEYDISDMNYSEIKKMMLDL